MDISYKDTLYNIDIAESLEDDVRLAWEKGHPYTCREIFLDEVADEGTSSDELTKSNRIGFVMFDSGAAKKVSTLVYEYVDPDYRDRQIGTAILEDSCNKLVELGYEAIYSSIKGHIEDIESKRYFLESQGFALCTNTLIPVYRRKDIEQSNWYKSFVNSEDLRSGIVDVCREEKDNDIAHKLAKEGVLLYKNTFVKAIVQGEELSGAILYGIEKNVLVIYDVRIFEKKLDLKLFGTLLLGVFAEFDKLDSTIKLVKVYTNNTTQMELLAECIGEPYDMEIREEWLLRLQE